MVGRRGSTPDIGLIGAIVNVPELAKRSENFGSYTRGGAGRWLPTSGIWNAHSVFGGQSSLSDELVNKLADKKGTAISVSRKIGEDQLRSEAIPYPQSQPGQLRRHKHAIRHLLLVRTNKPNGPPLRFILGHQLLRRGLIRQHHRSTPADLKRTKKAPPIRELGGFRPLSHPELDSTRVAKIPQAPL